MALVEILVSIAIPGILGAAVLGAAAAAAQTATTNRQIAESQNALSSTGAALMDAMGYVSCADHDNATIVASYQAQVDQITSDFDDLGVDVAAVSYWNGSAFAQTCFFDQGHRLQSVTLESQGGFGPSNELRVIRRPFDEDTATGVTVTTNPDDAEELAFQPTPGIEVFGSATTTTTTTTLPPPGPVECEIDPTDVKNTRSTVKLTITNSTDAVVTSWLVFVPYAADPISVRSDSDNVSVVSDGFEVTNFSGADIAPGGSSEVSFEFNHPNKASNGFDFTCEVPE